MSGDWIENSQFHVHWDHHPSPKDTPDYGAGTNADEIRAYVRAVRPDMMQYHALGCHGYASFPSRVAPPVPGLVGDPLRTWKEVCEQESIRLGIYVATYVADYPEPVPQWREVDREGRPRQRCYCYNGPWTEEFLIPLLLELMERYAPSHFWLDGAWLPPDPCYCEHCKARFRQLHGYELPLEPTEEQRIDVQAMRELSMDAAFEGIRRAIKAKDPAILMACNSAYYFRDLRRPAGVDWLSWDVLNMPDWRQVSFESAYLATAGLPADLMVYEKAIISYADPFISRLRPLVHLKTEVASILAHGVRLNYWQDPEPDGALEPSKKEMAAAIGEFVRERGNWCIGGKSAAEVAIFASRRQHLADHPWLDARVRAMYDILKQGHVPCDVVRDDTLSERLSGYRLIIVPETRLIFADTADVLTSFATSGGTVLIVGDAPSALASLDCPQIGALLSQYAQAAEPAVRDQVLSAVRQALTGRDLVAVEAPTGVEVVLTRRNGDLYVHFVNHVPGRVMHEMRERLLDEVTIVRGVRARIRVEEEPASVVLMPGSLPLGHRYRDGHVEVELPPLEYHYAVRIAQAPGGRDAADSP